MDLERTFILSNVIKKLEEIQSNSCNTNSEIFAALKEEIKTFHKEENKNFINDVCNFLVLPVTNSNRLKGQLYNLLINKENIEIYNFCNKLLKYL